MTLTIGIRDLTDANSLGTRMGQTAAELICFYGLSTAVSQRSSSNQITTNIASSTAFSATHLAVLQEVMNTLTGLGLWKGS